MHQKYTEELRNQICKLYREGQPVKKISRYKQIPKSTIYFWLKRNAIIKRTKGITITAKEVHMLEKKINRLKIENAIFSDTKVSSNSSYKDKLEAISKLDDKYPVYTMCKVLKIRRSNYYHYKFRSPVKTKVELDDEIYKPIVKRIFEETKGRIGSKKIKALMEMENIFISAQRISRLMKEQNLVCVTNKKYKRYNHAPKSKYYKNVLDRNFNVENPNKVWVSDITTIYINYEPFYLCPVIDLFARKVVGYSVGNHQETSLIELAFKKALDCRKPEKGLLFHNDMGAQFTSYSFRKILRKYKVKQSFSNAGCPYDNAVAESFFRHLKSEQIYPTYYPNYSSFKEAVDEYIDFFNNRRPHHSLNNSIPSHFEKLYFQQNL